MKLSVKPQLLKLFALAGGILGLLLHIVLYETGMDGKGLLISGHWAGGGLWILTALVLAAVILLTRGIRGPEDYRDTHPVSFLGGIGCFVLAAALGMTAWKDWCADTTLDILMGVLMFAAALSLIYIGICRMSGGKPAFLAHSVLCACFAIRMVWQYQFWSSDPQLMDYVFFLGAYAALMLAAYQQAAFDADMCSHWALWAASLAAVYFCIVALRAGVDTWILLTGGLWALTNTTCLNPKPRRRRPEMNLEDEPQEEV